MSSSRSSVLRALIQAVRFNDDAETLPWSRTYTLRFRMPSEKRINSYWGKGQKQMREEPETYVQ